jgi:hypothetical protein
MSFIRAMFGGRRQSTSMNYGQLLDMIASSGEYGFPLRQTLTGDREEIESNFTGLVSGAYAGNGIVFAVAMTKFLLFSEARFQFQQLRGGTPGNLFGTAALQLLERPEPGKVTGDLLSRASLDSDFAGNSFHARRAAKGDRGERIKRMRPDWVSIVLGSSDAPSQAAKASSAVDLDAEVIGYAYIPGGTGSGNEPIKLLAEEVSHFAPIPDPLAHYRGMSPMLPVIRNILGDKAAVSHKLNYFRAGATPNLIVTLPDSLQPDEAQTWIDLFEQDHTGASNAWRTIYFAGGASGEVVGSNLKQLDFKAITAVDETRIAAAIGTHPVVAALSEGMQGSSLNAGNFGAAARLMGDAKLRPMWRNMANSLENIIDRPRSTRLWYDDRDIPFLREDAKVRSEIQQHQAGVLSTLFMAGFEPNAIIEYVKSGDLDRLTNQHTGLASVQLTPIGAEPEPEQIAAWSAERQRLADMVQFASQPSVGFRAIEEFWPADGAFAGQHVRQGEELPGTHPLVWAFPSMFDAVPRTQVTVSGVTRSAVGPGPIVSEREVLSKKAELVAAGKPAGYDSIAKELRVSRDTVRRRLNGHSRLEIGGRVG